MHAALQAPRGALTVHARLQQLACRIAPRRTRWHRSLSSSGPQQLPRERLASVVLHAKNSRAMQELMAQREEEKEEEEGVPVATKIEWESPLKILPYPDPRLRAPNARIGVFNDDLVKLAEEMFEIMYEDDGVGLAAPQVGVNLRLMVFNETGERDRKDKEMVLVNPYIVSSNDTEDVFEEGCLSFPKIYADVWRPTKIKVKAQSIAGKKVLLNLSGFPARIFQHEYDHLQGTLFHDRMEPKVLEGIRGDLVALEEAYLQQNPGAQDSTAILKAYEVRANARIRCFIIDPSTASICWLSLKETILYMLMAWSTEAEPHPRPVLAIAPARPAPAAA